MAVARLAPKDLPAAVSNRLSESDIWNQRNGRSQAESDKAHKDRCLANRNLYYGVDFGVKWADGTSKQMMSVANIANTSTKDLARIVSESLPSRSSPSLSLRQEDITKAHIREAIGETHWYYKDDQRMIKWFAMDLALDGVAYCVSYIHENTDYYPYPCHLRLDPEFCYPTYFQNHLIDLLHVSELPLRTIAAEYPQLKLNVDPKDTRKGEVIDYWSAEQITKLVVLRDRNNKLSSPEIIFDDPSEIEEITVSWAPVFGPGWRFEGLIDQLAGPLNGANQMLGLVVDDADNHVFAKEVVRGDIREETEGPRGRMTFAADDGSGMEFQSPTPLGAGVVQLGRQLEESARESVAFPAARQGNLRQSIVSAAGIQAFQGERESLTRDYLGHMGSLLRQVAEKDYRLDQTPKLDFRKPLLFPVGDKSTYKPSEDIGSRYIVKVIYTSGGMDPLNSSVQAGNKVALGLLSPESAIEQDPTVRDKAGELQKIEKAETLRITRQRVLTDPAFNWMRYAQLQGKEGKTALDAIDIIMNEGSQVSPTAQAQPGAQGVPGQPTPANLTAEQLAKGGQPGQTPGQGPTPGGEIPAGLSFNPQPLPQSITQSRSNG